MGKHLPIENPEQFAALTSPLRIELLELFGIFGPCSIADVAARLDRPADSLYYHVKKLEAAGLLLRDESRRKGRRSEATFKLPADDFEIERRPDDRTYLEMSGKAIDSFLRLTGRQLKAALADASTIDEGPQRTMYGRRMRGKLTKSDVRELNRHVKAIEAIYARAASKRTPTGTTVATTVVLTPAH